MKQPVNHNPSANDSYEKLIRVRAQRRGRAVEVRVHYAAECVNGCDTYRILKVEDAA